MSQARTLAGDPPERPCGLHAARRVLPPALLHRLIVSAGARTRIASGKRSISDLVAATVSRSVLVSRARGKGSAGNVSGQRRTAAAVMVARCRQAGNRRRREW